MSDPILFLVPARAGSRRVPGKNLRPLAGIPLVGWAVLNVTDPLLGTSTTGSLGSVVIGTVVIGAATLAGLVVARVPEIREPLAAVRARVGRG